MDIITTATRVIHAPPDDVWNVAVGPARLPEIFVGYGPIPAVIRAEMAGGAPMAEGSTLAFEDATGAKLTHTFLRFDRPRAWEYDLKGFGPPFSLLVRAGYARWTFEPEGGGTRVTWRYTFPLTSRLAYPAARLVLGVFMKRAMERCLERVSELVKRTASER